MTAAKPPGTRTRARTSELMVDFMHRLEKRLYRRLTPLEARSPLFKQAARVYAEAMIQAERITNAETNTTQAK